MEHSGSRVMTDQEGTGGMREPGGAARPRVSGGAKGGRSQGGADRSTGRDRVRTPKARGGAVRSCIWCCIWLHDLRLDVTAGL